MANRSNRNDTWQGGKPDDPYAAEKVRQGTIILRKRRQRAVFIAGLAGAVLLALLMSFRGGH